MSLQLDVKIYNAQMRIFHIVASILFQATLSVVLLDSETVSGSAEAVMDINGFYPSSLDFYTRQLAVSRGERHLFYVRLVTGDSSLGIEKVYTSAFFPGID